MIETARVGCVGEPVEIPREWIFLAEPATQFRLALSKKRWTDLQYTRTGRTA
jgi:hypothetical protein